MSEPKTFEIEEKTKAEQNLDKLVSAFLGLALDLIESGEADKILKGKSKERRESRVFFEKLDSRKTRETVSSPVFQENTSKKRGGGKSSGFEQCK